MKVYFLIPLNYQLTGDSENFKSDNIVFKKDPTLKAFDIT